MNEYEALKRLSNAIFDGRPLRDVINLCAEIIGTPLRFTWHQDPDGGILSQGYPYDDWRAWKEYVVPEGVPSRDYLYFLSDTYVIQHGTKPFVYPPDGPVHRRRLLCIASVGGRRAGHLSIPEMSVPLEELDAGLIELCAKYTALCCFKSGQAEEIGSMREGMRKLLSDDISYAELGLLMGRQTLPQDGTFHLLVVRAVNDERNNALRALLDQLRSWYASDWALAERDNAVILYEGDRPEPYSNSQVIGHFREAGCSGCVSPAFHNLLHARLWFRRISALIPFRKAEAGSIINYLDWMDQGLFMESKILPDDMITFVPEGVLSLWRLDQTHGTEYIRTLNEYFTHSCNQNETAEALFVHPNTIAYRMKKIAAEGLSLDEPGQMIQTVLGLRILRYITDVSETQLL